MSEIERRTICARELRASDEGDGPARISGYAAVYNSLSEDLGGFREMIAPGAFGALDGDVRALWNHNSDYVLGRTRSGTLALSSDEIGLAFEATPPDTQWARDLMTTIRRGDVDQMSFGFRTVRDEWRQETGQAPVRTLLQVELYDVSPVTFPAYPQTSAQVRARVSEMTANAGLESGQADGEQAEQAAARARLAVKRHRLELEIL